MVHPVMQATADDMPAVKALLAESGLPTEGLRGEHVTVFLVRDERGIAACGAVEVYGRSAVLRSVAVAESSRGRGLGVAMTEAALAFASQRGVTDVYLLTETAEAFFPRFGFEVTDRGAVPPAIAQSIEFATLCPQSAVAMWLGLPTSE